MTPSAGSLKGTALAFFLSSSIFASRPVNCSALPLAHHRPPNTTAARTTPPITAAIPHPIATFVPVPKSPPRVIGPPAADVRERVRGGQGSRRDGDRGRGKGAI